jgi:hypothetical protein
MDTLLTQARAGQWPVLAVQGIDESFFLDNLHRAAGSDRVRIWRCTTGFDNTVGNNPPDLAHDLALAAQTSRYDIQVFLDTAAWLDRPDIIRVIRDTVRTRDGQPGLILLYLEQRGLPPALSRWMPLIQLPAADKVALAGLVRDVAQKLDIKTEPEWLANAPQLLAGMSLFEAQHCLTSAMPGPAEAFIQRVMSARRWLAPSQQALVWTPVDNIPDPAGLGRLKHWVDQRQQLFYTHQQHLPAGILLMGVSGCGKSLGIKSLAKRWQLPLYRLEVAWLHAQGQSPETRFTEACDALEQMAPAVLWIDEIENAFALGSGDPTQERLFACFLTWLQEKNPRIFVAATANRIEQLPAELLRKGRFDQIFFCDLPRRSTRRDILRVHMSLGGLDPDRFDLDWLADNTSQWNAAELAVLVRNALGETRGKPDMADFRRLAETSIPLANSMAEQIKFIRDWAWDRATNAEDMTDQDLNLAQFDETEYKQDFDD